MKTSAARGAAVLLVVAIALRLIVFPEVTIDFEYFLRPWLAHAEAAGGGYLKKSFTNYSAFYEHALALMATLPGSDVLRIKLFSTLFDVILAYAVTLLVPSGRKALAFGITLAIPTIILNSAFMAQADAMYTAMAIFALGAVLKNKPVWAMLAFSVAIAIKFQALLFLPVFALLFLERRQPLWTFALIPLAYVLFALPMFIAGRPLDQIFLVYYGQFGTYDMLSAHAPNPWIILGQFIDYKWGVMIGLPLAAAIVGGAVLWLWRSGIAKTEEGLLLAVAILLILGPFVAPKMHDRYFYMVDPVLVVLLCRNRDYLLPLVLAEAGSLLAYVPFAVLKYHDADGWLMGDHGFLQGTLGFRIGMIAALGVIPMGAALLLLIRKAMKMQSPAQTEPDAALPNSKMAL